MLQQFLCHQARNFTHQSAARRLVGSQLALCLDTTAMTQQLFERERKPAILTLRAQFCTGALEDWEAAGS